MSAHVSERLSAYLDDELDPSGRAAVDEHLGACEACARELEALAAIDGLARELPPHEAPRGYFEAFPARVRRRLEGRARRAWRLPAWTWAAAAAALLAVIAPLALRRARPMVPPVEPPVAERAAPPTATLPTPPESTAEGERADARARAPLPPAPVPPPPAAPRAAPPAAQEGFARAPAASPTPARNQLPAREAARDTAAPAIPTEAGSSGLTASQARRSGPGGPLGQSQQLAESGRAPSPGAPPSESDEEAGKVAGAPESKVAAEAPSKEEQRPQEPPLSKGRLRSRAGAEDQYRALLVHPTPTLAEARALREAWRAFSLRDPAGPHADEARVRVVEAGALAWELGGASEDRTRARADAEAYLARGDAAQAARVRAALEGLER